MKYKTLLRFLFFLPRLLIEKINFFFEMPDNGFSCEIALLVGLFVTLKSCFLRYLRFMLQNSGL